MKKIKILAMTSAAVMAMTAMAPMSAYAAVHTYRIPGRGMAVVVGSGSSVGSILEQIQNGLGNCRPQLPSLPGQPDTNLPGQPDTNLPGQPDTNLPGQPDTEQPGRPDSGSSFAAQVVELVNAQRAQAGLSALRLDTNAAQAAQTRAKEIQTSFSHTRPNGSHFSTALKEAGVSYRSCGENIAWGQKTPEEVMEGWMNSSGHRANILNPEYTAIGVGYAQNGAGTGYWTQLFIR